MSNAADRRLSRRDFLQTSGGAAALAVGAGSAAAQGKRPRNILFMMTDEQHHQALACAGNPLIKTPNLDRLAARGAQFDQALCPTPYCSPSRASILTGRYPHSHGVALNVDPLHWPEEKRKNFGIGPEDFTITEQILHDGGYATHHRGKWHAGVKNDYPCYDAESLQPSATNHGYLGLGGAEYFEMLDDELPAERFEGRPGDGEWWRRPVYMIDAVKQAMAEMEEMGRGGFPTLLGRTVVPADISIHGMVTKQVIDCIEMHENRDEPWMITASWHPPHDIWVVPEPYYSMYDRAEMPIPDNQDALPDWSRAWNGYKYGQALGEEGMREFIAVYYGMVTMIDDYVGRVLEALERTGQAEDTLIVFTSDHGDMVGSHGCVSKSLPSFYEAILRVPMIMTCPGLIEPGTKVESQVNLTDMMPTLLEYAGRPQPAGVEGASLWPLLNGQPGAAEDREWAYCERTNPWHNSIQRMIRGNGWKYAYNTPLRSAGTVYTPELYHLEEDPLETTNLWNVPARRGKAKELHARLRAWLAETNDPWLAYIPEDPDKPETAKAL